MTTLQAPSPQAGAQAEALATAIGDAAVKAGIVAAGTTLTLSAIPAAGAQDDARDAARYRWLRSGRPRTTGLPKPGRIEVFRWEDSSEGAVLKDDALDAAIDAAMSTTPPPAAPKEQP